MKNLKIIILISLVFFFQQQTMAQNTVKDAAAGLDNATVNEIDALLKQNTSDDAETSKEVINRPMTKKELKKLNVSDYSNIISETSYDDYSIVQRNYMPKSSRTQFKMSISSVTNDVFYANMGISLGASYHFNETWGAGLNYTTLNSNRNSYAKNIRDVQLVNIENLVTLKSTYGASIFYTPVYGKWSLLNRKVIPFEMYLQAGISQITNQADLVTTALTGGLGQLISLTRSSALDVNINWFFYSTKNINNQDQANNSMLLTIGYSIFWPKPNYR